LIVLLLPVKGPRALAGPRARGLGRKLQHNAHFRDKGLFLASFDAVFRQDVTFPRQAQSGATKSDSLPDSRAL